LIIYQYAQDISFLLVLVSDYFTTMSIFQNYYVQNQFYRDSGYQYNNYINQCNKQNEKVMTDIRRSQGIFLTDTERFEYLEALEKTKERNKQDEIEKEKEKDAWDRYNKNQDRLRMLAEKKKRDDVVEKQTRQDYEIKQEKEKQENQEKKRKEQEKIVEKQIYQENKKKEQSQVCGNIIITQNVSSVIESEPKTNECCGNCNIL